MKSMKRRNSTVLLLVMVLSVFTYFHNYSVADSTKVRDFGYQAWQALTRSSQLFSEVKSKDIFISEHQNDAFETNAGSFYYNTGIRLAYLFNTFNIWPNYSSCKVDVKCSLSNVRKHVLQTLPNLERGSFVRTNRSAQQSFDWVGINTKPGALDKSRIYDFDLYQITESTLIAYLAPYDENQTTASILLHQLKFVTISKPNVPVLHPVINGYCLVALDGKFGSLTSRNGLRINYWGLPTSDHHGNPLPTSLDIRFMAVGTC